MSRRLPAPIHARLAALGARAGSRRRGALVDLWAWLREAGAIYSGDPITKQFAEFGPGSRIEFPMVNLGNPGSAAIGANVYIRSYFCLEAYANPGDVVVRIGDGVQLGHNVRLVGFNGVELEEFVGIGHGTTIGDSVHDWKPVSVTEDKPLWDTGPKLGRKTRVLRGAFLGNNCVVTGGITIGEWSIVDHNTVLNRDVPARCIVGGYPPRVLRRRRDDQTWETLEDPPLLEEYGAEAAS
jgi:acetyltransferase-like isoleucine patch superfamily enzyme